MTKHIVVIAGNIGVGKTSLTERIGSRLTGGPDMNRLRITRIWLTSMAICVPGHSIYKYSFWAIVLSNISRPYAIRALRSSTAAFTKTSTSLRCALYHMGDVAERDYLAYRRLFEIVMTGLPRPNLLIYLKAPVNVLMDRIRRRARNMETGITSEYLGLLDSFYNDWLGAFDMCPVLTIRTDDLDFVHQQNHLDTVVERIQDKLAGKEVMEF